MLKSGSVLVLINSFFFRVYLVIVLCFFLHQVAFAQDIQVKEVVSEEIVDQDIKTQQQVTLDNFLKSSLAPTNFMPSVYPKSEWQNQQKLFLSEKYPFLLEAIDSSNAKELKVYSLIKANFPAKVFWGIPPYLHDPLSDKKTSEDFGEYVQNFLVKEELSKFFVVTKDPLEADVFLIPVKSNTLLDIKNPNIRWRYSLNPIPYSNVNTILEKLFFNVSLTSPNEAGLNGLILKNTDNKTVTSLCPIVSKSKFDDISDDIFYCLVQSQGLPGFRHVFSNADEGAKKYADTFLQWLSCEEVSKFDNLFQEEFVSALLNKCAKK